MSQPILIDTDAGDDIDDLLSIAFALLRPELNVKAITTVSPHSARRAALITRLLDTLGRKEIPVAPGMELPLRPLLPEERAFLMRPDVINHTIFEAPNSVATSNVPEDAISLILRTVEENADDIAIVTIGPLTNIACALQRKPEIAQKIRWIAIMGGEVQHPYSEHNIKWDYHASSIVFAAGIPLFLGTSSITSRFVLMPEECDLIHNRETPLCRFLSQCIKLWWPLKGDRPGPVMYDIAPLLWSYDRSFYPSEPMEIGVETKGEFTCGMTVRREGSANAEVSIGIRADAIKKLYLETILA